MRLINADDLPISSIDITDVGYYVSKYGKGIPAVYWEDIKDAPTIEPEQRWIPCSERLPEECEDIIVTYVDGEETRIIPVNYGKGTWYDCIFDTALNPIKVIAWMKLPEPYAERRQE